MKAIFAAVLIAGVSVAAAAQAQLSQKVSSTSYSGAGQTITYTYTFYSGSYTVSSISIQASIFDSSGHTFATLSPTCTGVPTGQYSTITCTATYTTTAADAAGSTQLNEVVNSYSVNNGNPPYGTFESGTSASPTVLTTNYGPPPSITTASVPSAKVGTSYSTTLAGSGGGTPYSWSVSAGTLPAGLSLGASSGTISGTPTAGGIFNFTAKITDAVGATATKAYTLTVAKPTVTVSPSTLPGATQGKSYSQTISASGGTASYSYAVTLGAVPAGMSLSSTGTLSGTPTGHGTFNFTVTATDSSTGTGPYTGSASYALSVTAATPVFSTTSLPNATAGTAYSQTIKVTSGNAPYSFSLLSGSLPTGLSLSSGGVLSGTPTQVGSFSFTVKVKDSAGTTATQGFTGFTVSKGSPALAVNLSSSSVLQGASVTMTATLSGGATPTGTITFKDGATTLATVPLSGLTASYATAGLAIGSHSITAVYSGDSLNTQVTSAAQALTVGNRPDPGLDPTVRSMIFSQVSTAVRFARTQIDNTSGRLGALHGEIASGGPNGTPGGTGTGGPAGPATAPPSGVQTPVVTRNVQAGPGEVVTTVSRAFEALEVRGGLPLHAWATGTLAFGKTQSSGAYDDRLTTSGLTLGIDRRFGADVAAGLAFGYGYDHTTFGPDGSRSNAQARTVSLYVTWQVAPGTFVDATGGYGRLSFDERRWSSGGGVMLSGQRGGHSLFGSLGMSRLGGLGGISTSSYGRVDVVRTSLDAYTETGSPLWALSYDKLTSTTVSGVAGISAQYAIVESWGTLMPGAKIEYRHAFSGGFSQRLGYADLGTLDYAIAGESQSQDALTLGLALHGVVAQNTDFDLEYQFSTDMGSVHTQQLRAALHFAF